MNYMQLFNDAPAGEISIDPHGKAAQMIAAQAHTTESQDPLDIICMLEDYLMKTHGMTFMQAVRAGILNKDVVFTH